MDVGNWRAFIIVAMSWDHIVAISVDHTKVHFTAVCDLLNNQGQKLIKSDMTHLENHLA